MYDRLLEGIIPVFGFKPSLNKLLVIWFFDVIVTSMKPFKSYSQERKINAIFLIIQTNFI